MSYLDHAQVADETLRTRLRNALRLHFVHRFSVAWNDDDACKCGAQRNYISGAVFYYR